MARARKAASRGTASPKSASRAAASTKSARQARFLFSEGSPLSVTEKGELASEIRRGQVTIEKQIPERKVEV